LIKICDYNFEKIKIFIYNETGIIINPSKKIFLENRLRSRLVEKGHSSFTSYFRFLFKDEEEKQHLIDLSTTNETYFFREKKHFEFLEEKVFPNIKDDFVCWSAASSIGAEAYSIAMSCEENLPYHKKYKVIGSDIDTTVLKKASKGVYPIRYSEHLSPEFLKKYCLKDSIEYEENFIIKSDIRKKVQFRKINLIEPLPLDLEKCDVIFLRNVLIYFDTENKIKIVNEIIKKLKPNGFLFTGHSESLYGINNTLTQIKPTIYQNLSEDAKKRKKS
jgi:chemotaxis protein methyltransferase CheR